jgi:hypothetical protein
MSLASHECRFRPAELARLAGLPLVSALALSGALHVAAALRLFPPPRPALDVDRTILLHQAHASRHGPAADVLLMGDSSCLTGISATRLAERLGRRVLNLATLSYASLAVQGVLLQEYLVAHPGRARTVVLLIHPEGLRLQTTPAYFDEVLRDCLAGRDPAPDEGLAGQLDYWTGVDLCRSRFLGRWFPIPLHGPFAPVHGFTTDLWRYLEQHDGSLVDPGRFDPRAASGNAEYRLARRYEAESFSFRAAVPDGVRLAVGLTPVPASFALAGHAAACRENLAKWASWLKADRVLGGLPLVLPDDCFASVTHLDAEGVDRFTEKLAAELGRDE